MTTFARLIDGRAAEVLDITDETRPAFHPDFLDLLVACPPEVRAGWVLADGEWSEPEPVVVAASPVISSIAFLARLAKAERAALVASPAGLLLLVEAMTSPTVDLSDADTVAALHAARDAGVISAARVEEILTP